MYDGSTDIGAVPRWYRDVVAAKYAGMPLAAWYDLPWWYQSRYIGAMNAEGEAQVELNRFQQAKAEREAR
jgi:hypothetical protein